MAEVSIAILGLKRVGTSLGLALKQYNKRGGDNTFKITGYDATSKNTKAAKEMKAVDKITNRANGVARDQDIVVIVLPYGEVEGAYEMIAADMRPGAVVIDMSPLPQSSLDVAAKHLREGVHVVCAAPILGREYFFDGVDETTRASDDLFRNGTMMLMPGVKCVKEAVSLAADLSKIVGAEPNFCDAAEYQALVAGMEAFPALLGALVFYQFSNSGGWENTQQFTNPSFAMLTRHLFDTHPDDLRDLCLDSGPALLNHIDGLISNLKEARALIAEKDTVALGGVLESTSENYEQWINRRMTGQWDDSRSKQYDMVKKSSMMGNMFGSAFGRGRGDSEDN